MIFGVYPFMAENSGIFTVFVFAVGKNFFYKFRFGFSVRLKSGGHAVFRVVVGLVFSAVKHYAEHSD